MEEARNGLLNLPDEILLNILSWIPTLDVFWCAGLTCQKLFALTCEILNNTIELREVDSSSENKFSLIAELRLADRLEEVFRREQILNCVSHVIVPSYYHNSVGMLKHINILF